MKQCLAMRKKSKDLENQEIDMRNRIETLEKTLEEDKQKRKDCER